MRLSLEPRALRMLRPRADLFGLVELALIALIAVQCARLVWTLVTPVGPVGDWQAQRSTGAAGAVTGAAGFDPFFRLAGQAGPVAVTSLNLKLFGVRQDQASGRGSAIIGTPDGAQRSFAVGEEIMPGVLLKAVDFDSVTITREGADEQLYMDQSGSAPVVGPAGPAASAPGIVAPSAPTATTQPPPAVVAPPAPKGDAARDIRAEPRTNGREVTGVAVFPQGSGEAFRAAGLAPGDVVIAVNGQRIRSAEQARGLAAAFQGPRPPQLRVERDGRVITLQPGTGR
ncbi:MAG: type II secretion system protein N [Allosphingosinicella sp.]